MLLIHRITPFLIGCSVAAGFLFLLVLRLNPVIVIITTLIVVALLFGRLLGWKARSFQFWAFVMTPVLYVFSAFALILFLEGSLEKSILAAFAAVFVFFFAEHLFSYAHVPAKYTPYALEYLTLLLSIITLFLASSAAFGFRMLVQVPIPLLAVVVFVYGLFLGYVTFWASKMEHSRSLVFAVGGAILLTELFAALAFLPTGFYANAAVLVLAAYGFFGISRAHFVNKLSRRTISWYALSGIIMLGFLAGTAQWI